MANAPVKRPRLVVRKSGSLQEVTPPAPPTGGADDIGRLLSDAVGEKADDVSPVASSIDFGAGTRYSFHPSRPKNAKDEVEEVTAKSESLDLVALEAAAAQSDALSTGVRSVAGPASDEEATITSPLAKLRESAEADAPAPPSIPELSEDSRTMRSQVGDSEDVPRPPPLPSMNLAASARTNLRPEVSEDIVAPARISVRPPAAAKVPSSAPGLVAAPLPASLPALASAPNFEDTVPKQPSATAPAPATTPVVLTVSSTRKKANVVPALMLAAGVLVGFGVGFATARVTPKASASVAPAEPPRVHVDVVPAAAPPAPAPVVVTPPPVVDLPVVAAEPPPMIEVTENVTGTKPVELELDAKPAPSTLVHATAPSKTTKPVAHAWSRPAESKRPVAVAPKPAPAPAKPAPVVAEAPKPAPAPVPVRAAAKPDDDVAARIAAANKELESALH
ncbi:MAG: hypothetical protein U0169_24355 [Polyangiaceae bacterium]